MKNKILLIIFTLAFLGQIQIVLLLFFDGKYISILENTFGVICFVIPMYMIVSDSKLLKTFYGKLILFGLVFFFLGFMFKIMHWPGANSIFLVSAVALMIIYIVRFVKKEEKHLLDWIKICWFELYVTVMFFAIIRFSINMPKYMECLKIGEIFLFYLMFGYFLYLKYKDKSLFADKE
jgi:hypothetical protein